MIHSFCVYGNQRVVLPLDYPAQCCGCCGIACVDDYEYENIKPDTVYWVGMSDFIAGGGKFGLPRLKTLDKSPFKVMDSK